MANSELTLHVRTAFAEVLDVIPPKVRTAIAITAVLVAVVALGAQQIAAIWWPEGMERVDATVAKIVPWMLFVIGVVSTAYRPTRNEIGMVPPTPTSPLEMAKAQESAASTVVMLASNGWEKDEAIAAVQQQTLLPTGESPGQVSRS